MNPGDKSSVSSTNQNSFPDAECPTSVIRGFDRHRKIARNWPWQTWVGKLDRKSLLKDLLAGLTGAVVVLPQGVAFAAIAGLPPQYGLYTAMIPTIIAALFGSSHHLISGPTTTASIVVFATLSPLAEPGSQIYIQMALSLAFLSGAIRLALGLARLGLLVNFVSQSVVVGFTSGAAVLICSSQFKHLFGIDLPNSPWFIHNLLDLIHALPQINAYATTVGITTLILAVVLRWFRPRWPYMLLAMLVGSILALILGAESHHIALVGSIPNTLPPLSVPDLSLETIKKLSSGSLAIALLGLIEAISIARSVGIHSKQKIDGNWEFIGQGLSNMTGSFFSAYPSSGSFTRSGVNYRAGAKTPLAAVFSSLWLVMIVVLLASYAHHLPIPSMAGILLVVAFNLIDFKEIRTIFRSGPTEMVVMLVAFFATLFLELEFAIYSGVMLSLVIFLHRTSSPIVLSRVPDPLSQWRSFVTDPDLPECPQLKIIRIDGALYFGSVAHVEEMIRLETEGEERQPNLLIVCSGINFVDLPGVEMLIRTEEIYNKAGGTLFFFGVKDQVCEMFYRSGYLHIVGQNHIFQSKMEAVQNIVVRFLDKNQCHRCSRKVFLECSELGNASRY